MVSFNLRGSIKSSQNTALLRGRRALQPGGWHNPCCSTGRFLSTLSWIIHTSHSTSTLQAGLESVGLGLQALGLAGGGDTSVGLNSAGEGGVFSALHWNSESAMRKRSRHWIRPDSHLPYDKSFDEMSYRELVFGMVCVLQSIMKSQDSRL